MTRCESTLYHSNEDRKVKQVRLRAYNKPSSSNNFESTSETCALCYSSGQDSGDLPQGGCFDVRKRSVLKPTQDLCLAYTLITLRSLPPPCFKNFITDRVVVYILRINGAYHPSRVRILLLQREGTILRPCHRWASDDDGPHSKRVVCTVLVKMVGESLCSS
jgi:hypothetical protein